MNWGGEGEIKLEEWRHIGIQLLQFTSDLLVLLCGSNLRSPSKVERQEEVESTERREGVGEEAPDLPLGPYCRSDYIK